jgi:hypothetical protein
MLIIILLNFRSVISYPMIVPERAIWLLIPRFGRSPLTTSGNLASYPYIDNSLGDFRGRTLPSFLTRTCPSTAPLSRIGFEAGFFASAYLWRPRAGYPECWFILYQGAKILIDVFISITCEQGYGTSKPNGHIIQPSF